MHSIRAPQTVAEYLGGTANFRTDLYAGPTSGTLLTHKESIELFKKLGVQDDAGAEDARASRCRSTASRRRPMRRR